jgi:hypothetical protein
MGSMVAMRGRIGSYSDRRRTIEQGFGLGLSVVVVALPIGWFRTVFRCGTASGAGTLAERFGLDRSGSQIEKLIDFGSYYISRRDRYFPHMHADEQKSVNARKYVSSGLTDPEAASFS